MKYLLAVITAALFEIGAGFFLSGCGNQPDAVAVKIDGTHISPIALAQEFCYKGIVYVQFYPASNTAWGGVKLLPNGQPETCKVL